MKIVSAIQVDHDDLYAGGRWKHKPFYQRLKPTVRDAVDSAEVVVFNGTMVKARMGMSEQQKHAVRYSGDAA